jgi:hypothetical protein
MDVSRDIWQDSASDHERKHRRRLFFDNSVTAAGHFASEHWRTQGSPAPGRRSTPGRRVNWARRLRIEKVLYRVLLQTSAGRVFPISRRKCLLL